MRKQNYTWFGIEHSEKMKYTSDDHLDFRIGKYRKRQQDNSDSAKTPCLKIRVISCCQ